MTPIQQSGAEPGYRVGVDVGGTKIEAALVSPDGEIVASRRIPARRGGDRLVDDVTAIVRDVAGDRLAGVRAVGIGTPGQVDSAAGRIANVVNLGIDTLELGPLVSGRLGVPVHVDNDVNAAALGAARSVVGSDLTGTIAFLNFGTGLAAGILIDGELQHGFSGAAGEIGHIPVDPNRLPCQCGQRGCLETVCSGASVGRLWPTENGAPPMPDLIRAAHAGDEHAVEVLGKVAHAMVDTIRGSSFSAAAWRRPASRWSRSSPGNCPCARPPVRSSPGCIWGSGCASPRRTGRPPPSARRSPSIRRR